MEVINDTITAYRDKVVFVDDDPLPDLSEEEELE